MMTRALPGSPNPIALFDPRARPLYLILVGVWAALELAGPLLRFSVDSELLLLAIPLVLLLAMALALKTLGLSRAATAVECLTLLLTVSLSFVLLSFLLARLDLPYVDHALAGIERTLGFDWPSMAIAFNRVGWLSRAANFVYQSLWWQIVALVLLQCAAGNRERCWRFALAWTLSLVATLAIFAFAPAIGAYGFNHIGHGMVSDLIGNVGWRQAATLEHLRHATAVNVTSQDLDGIVEFPSFHAAAAVLLCWGFWSVKPARYVALPLNLGVIVAAVPIGGHYLTDIPAGAAIAVLGIKSAAHRLFQFSSVQPQTRGQEAAVAAA
jgi:membrane-associated phospholipid phosphatase